MAKKAEKDFKRFYDETDSFVSKYVYVYDENFKEDIKKIAQKNKIWTPIYPRLVEFPDGTAQICVIGINFEMSVQEVFAKGLDAYFHDKEKLKKYNPELYDIIEKEVIPDLR